MLLEPIREYSIKAIPAVNTPMIGQTIGDSDLSEEDEPSFFNIPSGDNPSMPDFTLFFLLALSLCVLVIFYQGTIIQKQQMQIRTISSTPKAPTKKLIDLDSSEEVVDAGLDIVRKKDGRLVANALMTAKSNL